MTKHLLLENFDIELVVAVIGFQCSLPHETTKESEELYDYYWIISRLMYPPSRKSKYGLNRVLEHHHYSTVIMWRRVFLWIFLIGTDINFSEESCQVIPFSLPFSFQTINFETSTSTPAINIWEETFPLKIITESVGIVAM